MVLFFGMALPLDSVEVSFVVKVEPDFFGPILAEVHCVVTPLPSPASQDSANCTLTSSPSGSVTLLAVSEGRVRIRTALDGAWHVPPGLIDSWDIPICLGGWL